MKRKRWLVISWMDEDGGRVVFDTVLAATDRVAERAVRKVRGVRCTVSEVWPLKAFATRVSSWVGETPAQVSSSWRLTSWLRTCG
jgi:hypothetical protein